MAGIRTNQLDEQDFRQTYVTREEITQETFNDEGFGFVFTKKEDDITSIEDEEVILSKSIARLLNSHETNHPYNIGDICFHYMAPSWARLECVTAGLSSEDINDLSNKLKSVTKSGTLLTDGEVTWIVDDIRDGNTVGDIKHKHTLQDGYLPLNGQEVNINEYPRLYKYAVDNNLIVDLDEWNNYNQGLFAYGIIETQFRLPDFRAMFIRGVDNNRGMDENRRVGSYQKGTLVSGYTDTNTSRSVSMLKNTAEFYSTDSPLNFESEYNDSDIGNIYLNDCSTLCEEKFSWNYSNKAYGVARPRNIALTAQIKY